MTPPARRSLKNVDARIDRTFGLVVFVTNRHLIDHMRRLTVELQLDLEMVFIWGTLAMMNVMPFLPHGADPLQVLTENGRIPEMTFAPVRLTDLCQITGLPRETIRRKLKKLQELGKVEQITSHGWVYLPQGVDESLRAFNKETVIRLLATAEEVSNILSRV